jgi:polar amino acid transport system substrate-binding protein
MGRATILFTMLLALAASGAARAADAIRIAFEDKEQPPYYMGEGTAIDWAKPGISVAIVKKAAEDLGFSADFKRQPWKRCLDDLKAGNVDAIFNSSFQKERQEYGVYPGGGTANSAQRITTIAYSLYRKKGNPVSWDGKAFTNLDGPIGAVAGYSIVGDLKKMSVAVEEANSTDVNLKKLLAGRIPGVAAQDVTADQFLTHADFADLEKVKPPLVTKDYFVMLSRAYVDADPARAAKFWAKIGELRDPMTAQLAPQYAQ